MQIRILISNSSFLSNNFKKKEKKKHERIENNNNKTKKKNRFGFTGLSILRYSRKRRNGGNDNKY